MMAGTSDETQLIDQGSKDKPPTNPNKKKDKI